MFLAVVNLHFPVVVVACTINNIELVSMSSGLAFVTEKPMIVCFVIALHAPGNFMLD